MTVDCLCAACRPVAQFRSVVVEDDDIDGDGCVVQCRYHQPPTEVYRAWVQGASWAWQDVEGCYTLAESLTATKPQAGPVESAVYGVVESFVHCGVVVVIDWQQGLAGPLYGATVDGERLPSIDKDSAAEAKQAVVDAINNGL